MKKIIIILILGLITFASYGQKKPNEFPIDYTPADQDALYTQEAVLGVPSNRKFLLPTLRTYFKKNEVQTIDVTTTVATDIDVVYIDASEHIVFLTVPSAGSNLKKTVRIVKTDSTTNPAYVKASSGTVRGSAAIVLLGQWTELTITSDGTNYK